MNPPLLRLLVFALFAAPLFAADLPVENPLARGQRITALLATESLGPLRLKLPEKDVVQILGKPGKRSEIIHTEADGLDAQLWFYPKAGLTLKMVSSTGKNGPKFLAVIDAGAKCTLATQRGIRIGSGQSEVLKAYAGTEDLQNKDFRGFGGVSFVVGSIFNGIVFEFDGGRVDRIFFGPAVECRTRPSPGLRG